MALPAPEGVLSWRGFGLCPCELLLLLLLGLLAFIFGEMSVWIFCPFFKLRYLLSSCERISYVLDTSLLLRT